MPYSLSTEGFRDADTGKVVRQIASTATGGVEWQQKQAASLIEYADSHSEPPAEARALYEHFRSFVDSCFLAQTILPKTILDIGCGEFRQITPYAAGVASQALYIGADPIPTERRST